MSVTNVLDALRSSRQHALTNAAVLDHIATPSHPRPDQPSDTQRSPSPDPPSPISKHLLTNVFAALDQPPSKPNYVFVENHQRNHFLYGLVLPLIARVLAVSCPGLLAVVQLPRSDSTPEWATPSSDDGYGSNGSNGSNGCKSNAATTPSMNGNSRTPSPSDDGNSTDERKSNSPELPPTSQLLRRAEKELQQHNQEQQHKPLPTESRPLSNDDRASPSPDAVNQDHRALRLICNGFEVLTGKMPPPRKDMGGFTLASVGWEKAGVIAPSHSSRGLPMSFSNGMVTPTEGIVASFSNGSLCLLTLWDPLSNLHTLKISHETPVIVFTFAAVGHLSVGELISKDHSALSEPASRVKTICERPNFMFVEIGHGAGPNLNAPSPEQLPDTNPSRQQEDDNSSNRATSPSGPARTSPERQSIPRYVPMDAVPRAIPLFVNTTHQCFVDPPYQDIPENAYENALLNDRYRVDKQQKQQQPPVPYSKPAEVARPASKIDPETQQREANQAPNPVQHVSNGKLKPNEKTPASAPLALPASNAATIPASVAPDYNAVDTRPMAQSAHPPVFDYYGYRSDHAYPAPHQHGHDALQSRQVLQPSVEIDPHHHIHHRHPGYYIPPANGVISNPPYAHHSGSPYPVGAYYAAPPQPGLHHHQVPDRHPAWHPGVPSVPHPAGHVPAPHLMHQRRDIPMAYPPPRPFQPGIGGQYASPYYMMPPSSQIYRQNPPPLGVAHPSVVKSSDIYRKPHGPHHNYAETFNGAPQAPGSATREANRSIPHSSAPALAPGVASQPKGSTVASNRDKSVDAKTRTNPLIKYDGIDEEKEKVLEALVGMRDGAVRSRNVTNAQAPWKSTDDCSDHRPYPTYSQQAPAYEQRISPHRPMCGMPNSVGNAGPSAVPRGYQSPPSRRMSSKRQQRPSDTQSSTSTNSQGAMLMNGAVTGSSHVPDQGYAGWQQKRQRQR
ncbi:hypothetical protein BWQ96_00624 [Gracilariopsis chorda]|uniref:Uncharacterized protein n=1 Tax=Gracilariopsis chorda TaxID=448386 RepID=A0A2V3J5A6_9FLOR|nr:hypothetical protein BWQ96_00624 [Gracilariopsis chorda]|eukprot:PXF49554.1 hypothetical protein BWQ96_00624 [Gracilariopsis chorda]